MFRGNVRYWNNNKRINKTINASGSFYTEPMKCREWRLLCFLCNCTGLWCALCCGGGVRTSSGCNRLRSSFAPCWVWEAWRAPRGPAYSAAGAAKQAEVCAREITSVVESGSDSGYRFLWSCFCKVGNKTGRENIQPPLIFHDGGFGSFWFGQGFLSQLLVRFAVCASRRHTFCSMCDFLCISNPW